MGGMIVGRTSVIRRIGGPEARIGRDKAEEVGVQGGVEAEAESNDLLLRSRSAQDFTSQPG